MRQGNAATRARLHVDETLRADARLRLAGDQAHYLGRVMRVAPGEVVVLFNGRDGEWRAEVEAVERKAVAVRLTARLRAQARGPDLWLLFAPVKRAPIDLIAAKATELGAAALWPVLTARTVASRVNLERLRANAVEAAEQCGRMDVPEVREPAALDAALAAWPEGRDLLWMDESGGGRPPADALAGRAGPAAVLVGPEGGFTHSELDALRQLPFSVAVSLGPRVLRAETAALSALVCWQALCGDWTRPTPGQTLHAAESRPA